MIDFNFIWITLVAIIGLNLLFFAIAFFLQKDYFTDLTYSLSFIFSVCFNFWYGFKQFNILKLIVLILVNLWALRLLTYLLTRILKIKIDHRFDNFRHSALKFLGFWIAQGFLCFLLTLPVNFLLNLNFKFNNISYLNLGLIIGFVFLWAIGFLIESFADQQKFNFINKNKNKLLNIKLWKISRHPNYFGELLQWYMLFAIALLMLLTTNFKNINFCYILLIISPLFLNISLLFWSGLPKLESSLYKRFKNETNYQEYIKKTSIIIPFIGKKNHIYKIRKQLKQK